MNLFSISSVILCLSGIAFSFIIYRTDRKNRINRAWFYSCISFSIWALSLSGVTLAKTAGVAFFWQKILDVSAIFLPYLYLVFVLKLLKIEWKFIKRFLFVCVILLSIFSFTSQFKIGMKYEYDFFWVDAGKYYFMFLEYFIFYAILCMGLLFYGYFKTEKNSIARFQIRNTIIGGVIGYGGGVTNFFPQLFSIYPYGNYLVILYIVVMVYGVLRYKLLSAKVISAQIFSVSLILISLFSLLKTTSTGDWLINFLIFVLVIIFSVFLNSSVKQEIKSREKAESLATDLESTNKHLEALNKQKSEFVSFATHQLRAPLTAMKGYASLLLEGDMGKLEPESREGISRIFDASKTLTNIVEDYLNLTRIELGSMKYAFDAVDLRMLIENIIAELKPVIDEKKTVKFSYDYENIGSTYRITADKDKLKQVIYNIIDNALKYTPSGSISVHLNFDRTKHRFILTVEDTGIGISKDILPRLFQKFSRADNANMTNIKGTGLGLYVAKDILEAHGGKIEAESKGEGKGSKFIIELEPLVTA